MKLQKLALAIVATLGVIGTTHAAQGQSYSGTGLLQLDGSSGVSTAGVNGVSIFGFNYFNIDPHFTQLGSDGNGTYDGVYSFISSVDLAAAPSNHHELGYWAFEGLGFKDVWFGEWAPENRSGSPSAPNGTIDYAKRVVFYIGNTSGLTLPSSGTVNYTVDGINRYNANTSLLTGTLTADFGVNKHITGSLSRTISGNTDTLTFNNVKFNGSTGVIDSSVTSGGSVSATYNSLGLSGTGDAYGQFFGNQASAGNGGLAGFAKFSNRNLDTAFGGKN